MKDTYDDLFMRICNDLDLPFAKIKAFADALTGQRPEFFEKDGGANRVGIMAVKDRLAMVFNVNPGELIKAEVNIQLGCEIIRKHYDDLYQESHQNRLEIAFDRYLDGWRSREEWFCKYQRKAKECSSIIASSLSAFFLCAALPASLFTASIKALIC